MTTHNPNCEGTHCVASNSTVRRLPLSGGGNTNLCAVCCASELRFRQRRNKVLPDDDQLDIPIWYDLPIVSAGPLD